MKNREKINGSESNKMANKKKKKNMKRLGGGGLSLEAFANAKSGTNFYNPALIKKQKEFYKNAKYVKKYKKLLKQQSQKHDSSDIRFLQDENETEVGSSMSGTDKNSRNRGISSLKVMYEKKHEEKEKARIDMEALDQARKEEKERVIAQRKAVREKMFKKTRTGQPVMKYRIEHLLETIQNSTKN